MTKERSHDETFKVLRDEYPGDAAWHRLAAAVVPLRDGWDLYPTRRELVEALGDEEVARVVYAAVGDRALAWIRQTIPALGGLTALQCIAKRRGLRALKTSLMRFPW